MNDRLLSKAEFLEEQRKLWIEQVKKELGAEYDKHKGFDRTSPEGEAANLGLMQIKANLPFAYTMYIASHPLPTSEEL